MANLSLREVNQSQLESSPVVDGQLIFCYDTGNIYHDTAGGRRQVGHDVFNVTELPLAALNEKIYCLPNGEMWLYLGDWVQLNYKYGVATETAAGLMSAADKEKTDAIVLDKLCMHDSEETTLEEYRSTCDYIDGGVY